MPGIYGDCREGGAPEGHGQEGAAAESGLCLRGGGAPAGILSQQRQERETRRSAAILVRIDASQEEPGEGEARGEERERETRKQEEKYLCRRRTN